MKRYTLRAAIHDALVLNQLRREYRRTEKNLRKHPHPGWRRLNHYIRGDDLRLMEQRQI